MIELLPGQRLDDQLVNDLRDLALRADEIGQGGTANARHNAYRRYSERATRLLRYRLAPSEIAEVLQSRAHWTLLEGTSASLELIDLEGDDLKRRMTGLLDRALREFERWSHGDEVVVPDTNVFLRVLTRPVSRSRRLIGGSWPGQVRSCQSRSYFRSPSSTSSIGRSATTRPALGLEPP